MAEGQRMTAAEVVAQVRDGRLEDFVREAVALVAPDGTTFGVVFDTHGVNPLLILHPPSATLKDLAPLMFVCTSKSVGIGGRATPRTICDQNLE